MTPLNIEDELETWFMTFNLRFLSKNTESDFLA